LVITGTQLLTYCCWGFWWCQ